MDSRVQKLPSVRGGSYTGAQLMRARARVCVCVCMRVCHLASHAW